MIQKKYEKVYLGNNEAKINAKVIEKNRGYVLQKGSVVATKMRSSLLT